MRTIPSPACALLAAAFACAPFAAPAQTGVKMSEKFSAPWPGHASPDGLFQINGPWIGTLGDLIDPALATLSGGGDQDAPGMLQLSVAPARPGQTPYHGSEIQSLAGNRETKVPGYGFGYYETAMKVTDVPGVCAAFFWIEASEYGPHEWDFEFLTNEPWIHSADDGQVHLTLHPSNTTFVLKLPFNPSHGVHRYGFLWTPGTIVFTVDGKPAHTFTEDDLKDPVRGFIMANMTTGKWDWGGGPPSQKATTTYIWANFTPGVTSIPFQ